MSQQVVGFAVSFQACPVLFTTAGVVHPLTSAESDFPADAAVLESYLAHVGFSWSERTSPLEGSHDASGQTFLIHDKPTSATGLNSNAVIRPTTWLGTRKTSEVGYTRLSATCSQAETTSITVDKIPAWVTFPRTVYIDQEALSVDSGGGSVLTINSRAVLGTTQAAHNVRMNPDHKPRVFWDFPTFYRRKCVLWKISSANVATPLWRGYCNAPLEWDGTQTAYKFSCGPFWNLERMRPLGTPNVATQLRGFDASLLTASITYSGSPLDLSNGRVGVGAPTLPMVGNTIQDMAAATTEWIRQVASDHSITDLHAEVTADRTGLRFYVTKNMGLLASPTIKIGYTSGFHSQFGRSVSASSGDPADPRSISVILENPPTALIGLPYSRVGDIPVTRVDGMPTVWTDTPTTDTGHTTAIRYVLRGALGNGTLTLEPSGVTTTTSGPSVTVSHWQHDDPAALPSVAGIVDEAVQLYLCARIDSSHWLLALRYGIVENVGVVNGGVDTASWDWTYTTRVLSATEGGPNERTFYLDGSQTLDKLLGDTCKLHGCGIGSRGSKISVFPFSPPSAQVHVALTVGVGDIVARPKWAPMPDGIVNAVTIAGDDVNVNLSTPDSDGLFAPARRMNVELNGAGGYVGSASPDSLARYALARVTGLWSEPCASLTVATSIANLETVYIGDYVEVSEQGAPAGDGTRGMDRAIGQVISRKISIPKNGVGSLELELLMYPHSRIVGYAPCCRVASIAAAVLVIDVAFLTLSSTCTDYAGSNMSTYRYASTFPNDGGVSWFATDYLVKLVERDNVSPRTPEIFTVVSISPSSTPGSSTITLDGPPNAAWQTIITGGGIVDLVFQRYSNGDMGPDQKAFAFVGDETTELIDTSSDDVARFAP